MLRSIGLLALALSCILLSSVASTAADHFIVVGGGPNPFSNQASLESNVLFSQRVIADIRDDEPGQHIFFADGNIEKPDLQFQDAELEISPATLWMTRLFGDVDSAKFRYRNHEIENVSGPSRKSYLKQAFYELADQLQAGDRLIVYVTAHGGAAQSDAYYDESYYESPYSTGSYEGGGNDHDTTISLWNNESLKVSELDSWLNKFSKDVRVVMIMAQCHSGGFAHAIFHHADEKRGLNPQMRIGFFSQQHDRAAAGCTPEIDEHDYREYSTYFWEAIGGRTRTGEVIESSDFDGDGTVSLAEAHAHAIIASETIDVPVTASDAFLRKFSKIMPIPKEDEQESESTGFFGALFGAGKQTATDDDANTKDDEKPAEPLGRDQAIVRLLEMARPEQKAIITTLSKAMKVKPEYTVAKVRRKAKKLGEQVESATQLWGAASASIAAERQLLTGSLILQYPEIGNESFSPKMLEFVTEKAGQFVEFVESQPQCDSYLRTIERAEEKESKMEKAINREARMRRLLRTLESVLLEQNLPHHATETERSHYAQMLAAEQKGLGW